MEELEQLWRESNKEKIRSVASAHRAKIVNPVVFTFYILCGALYLLYTYYQFLVATDRAPAWLCFTWLLDAVDRLPVPGWLGSALLYVMIPVIVGTVMKLLLKLPSVKEYPAMPQDQQVAFAQIRQAAGIIQTADESVKIRSCLWVLFLCSGCFAVASGFLGGDWGGVALRALLTVAVLPIGYFLIWTFGFEGQVHTTLLTKIKEMDAWIGADDRVDRCVAAIEEGNYELARQILAEGELTEDLQYLAKLLGALETPEQAAKARTLFDTYNLKSPKREKLVSAYISMMDTYNKVAVPYHKQAEKNADRHISKGSWSDAQNALRNSYQTTAVRRAKYYYCVMKNAPDVEAAKGLANALNEACADGQKKAVQDIYDDAWEMIENLRGMLVDVFTHSSENAEEPNDGADWNGLPHQVDYANVQDS